MVRSSFSTLFFIRENRVRKDGTTIIEVLITVNGERCGFSTGKKVKATSWDKTKQQVKGKDEEAKSLNNYLKAVKAKLYQKEAELLGRGFIITAKLLCEAYQEKIESLTFAKLSIDAPSSPSGPPYCEIIIAASVGLQFFILIGY